MATFLAFQVLREGDLEEQLLRPLDHEVVALRGKVDQRVGPMKFRPHGVEPADVGQMAGGHHLIVPHGLISSGHARGDMPLAIVSRFSACSKRRRACWLLVIRKEYLQGIALSCSTVGVHDSHLLSKKHTGLV